MDLTEREQRDHDTPTPPQAAQRITTMLEATGKGANHLSSEDPETVVSDVLADLMHWTEAHGVTWTAAAARGRRHYEAERG